MSVLSDDLRVSHPLEYCSVVLYIAILENMKLSHKLTITLLAFSCMSLMLALATARWSFEQGFNKFIIAQEKERLTQLADMLALEYAINDKSWQGISPYTFSIQDNRPPPRGPRLRATSQRPPERHLYRPPNNEEQHIGPPTTLLDLQGNVIAGSLPDTFNRDEDIQVTVPIKDASGNIGVLESYLPPSPSSAMAQEFMRQQRASFIAIGAVALFVSLIIAIIIVPKMLSPFKEILKAVEQLTKRKYSMKFNQLPNDEFGVLMKDINALAIALQKHEATQKQWLADISHELRTPLSILAGEMELVEAGVRKFDHAQLASFQDEVARLTRLVNDLYQLSLSDVGGMHYDFSIMNIDELIKDVLAQFNLAFEAKPISVSTYIPSNVRINADAQRLHQVFSNIFSNSIEYTDAPGQLRITLVDDGKKVAIDIEDSAPGVSTGNEKHVFDPLYREDSSRKRRAEGAGLGLSICQSIIHAHKGTIDASRSELGGIKITINLPLTGDGS
ncbi:hypothetical protein E5672_14615 [Alteromonas portus]|uniref:histidine kinase n=1 Tax=Alteromonas portus TaxID=2565549 RepID=A0A4U0ZDE4_9ALTE|nr:ATP-binding protein [Alteromonas portus]TKB02338.1 hypothetical protein E5672_14615 [Alteromonas portus]